MSKSTMRQLCLKYRDKHAVAKMSFGLVGPFVGLEISIFMGMKFTKFPLR